jgi:hypothetical protein
MEFGLFVIGCLVVYGLVYGLRSSGQGGHEAAHGTHAHH